jgi:SAM-dependent methyltransferase
MNHHKDLTNQTLGQLIAGMRDAYAKGKNAMEYARSVLSVSDPHSSYNHTLATLLAYDLQAGTYARHAREHFSINKKWCRQLANLIKPVLPISGSIMEVGVGEATTLAGVLDCLGHNVGTAYGFDISWSRVNVARSWINENSVNANLFVADLLKIPMADEAIDVVYSSHSLEPNKGREEEALRECLRIARKAVVLVEPIYELASPEAQARMRHHGYIEGLYATAERLGTEVLEYRLLDFTANPLNPSGVLCLSKIGGNPSGGKDKCPRAIAP